MSRSVTRASVDFFTWSITTAAAITSFVAPWAELINFSALTRSDWRILYCYVVPDLSHRRAVTQWSVMFTHLHLSIKGKVEPFPTVQPFEAHTSVCISRLWVGRKWIWWVVLSLWGQSACCLPLCSLSRSSWATSQWPYLLDVGLKKGLLLQSWQHLALDYLQTSEKSLAANIIVYFHKYFSYRRLN